jgi:hypothetical protein
MVRSQDAVEVLVITVRVVGKLVEVGPVDLPGRREIVA